MCFAVWHVLIICICLLAGPAWALSEHPPERTPDNVIVGFYNIKWLGQSPHDYEKLARVIQNFDICAVLEIRNEQAMSDLHRELVKVSGQEWNYTFGVRTHEASKRPFHEAYGVFWREDRVKQGYGLVSNIWDFDGQFRNKPYIASFKAGELDFMLLMVHTRWTNSELGSRQAEVAELVDQVDFLRGFLKEDDIFVGGDFNYSAKNKHMKAMAKNAGLVLLDQNDATTFKKDNSAYNNAYDHIYATPGGAAYVEGQSQAFDVTRYIYGDNTPENMAKSKKELSDHLPVFMVLDRTPE